MSVIAGIRDGKRSMRRALGLLTFAVSPALCACGGGPQVRATPDYAPKALSGQRILLVPLAVSDELGDKRTGIVLSTEARRLASEKACAALAADWREGSVVCPSSASDAKLLGDVQQKFALDEPVPAEVWSTLRSSFHTDYALLFRPESVASSHEVKIKNASSQERNSERAGRTMVGALSFGVLGALLQNGRTIEKEATNETELGYTVSAVLVDTRSMKILKAGVHSGSDSKTVTHNFGYAEAPPSAPILEKIMVGLGEKMLDD